MNIITHPGRAHADEFLACSLLLYRYPEAQVLRREPSQEELDDPQTIVVDQGGINDPSRNLFDHHQDPSLPCAAVLVLEHLTQLSREDLYDILPWLKTMSLGDCGGLGAVGAPYNLDPQGVLALQVNPLGPLVLDLFSQQTEVNRADSVYHVMMYTLGRHVLRLVEDTVRRREFLEETVEIRYIRGQPVVYLPTAGLENPQFQLTWWTRRFCPKAVASVSENPRGGISLFRVDDHPGVDFRPLQGRPGVLFAHNSGFLASVENTELAWEYLEDCVQPLGTLVGPNILEIREVLDTLRREALPEYSVFRRLHRITRNLRGTLGGTLVSEEADHLFNLVDWLHGEYPDRESMENRMTLDIWDSQITQVAAQLETLERKVGEL